MVRSVGHNRKSLNISFSYDTSFGSEFKSFLKVRHLVLKALFLDVVKKLGNCLNTLGFHSFFELSVVVSCLLGNESNLLHGSTLSLLDILKFLGFSNFLNLWNYKIFFLRSEIELLFNH